MARVIVEALVTALNTVLNLAALDDRLAFLSPSCRPKRFSRSRCTASATIRPRASLPPPSRASSWAAVIETALARKNQDTGTVLISALQALHTSTHV